MALEEGVLYPGAQVPVKLNMLVAEDKLEGNQQWSDCNSQKRK